MIEHYKSLPIKSKQYHGSFKFTAECHKCLNLDNKHTNGTDIDDICIVLVLSAGKVAFMKL